MATFNYRDPATGDWVAFPVYATTSGIQGPVGPMGPLVLSGATGNTAVLGSDGQLFVPTSDLDPSIAIARYVDLPGDVMTGELFVPDQVVSPPVSGRAAAARGYVDQLVTVDLNNPTEPPSRDGQTWFVVGDYEPTIPPPTAPPTAVVGTWLDDATNTITWVDSVDPTVTGYEIYYSWVNEDAGSSDTLVGTAEPGEQEVFHWKNATDQEASSLSYAIRAVNLGGASSLIQVSIDNPAKIPIPDPGPCAVFDWSGNCSTESVFPVGAPIIELTPDSGDLYDETLVWSDDQLLFTAPAISGQCAVMMLGCPLPRFRVGAYDAHPDPWYPGDPRVDFCIGWEATTAEAPVTISTWNGSSPMTGSIYYSTYIGWSTGVFDTTGRPSIDSVYDGLNTAGYTGCGGVPESAVAWYDENRQPTLPGFWVHSSFAILVADDPNYVWPMIPLYNQLAPATSLQTFKWSRAEFDYSETMGLAVDPYLAATHRVFRTLNKYGSYMRQGEEGAEYLVKNVPLFRDASKPGSDMDVIRERFISLSRD